MEPIWGFLIYVLVAFIVSVIAGKRMSALRGVIYFIVMCGASFLLVVVTSNITDGNGLAAGFMAFTSPLIGLIIALSSRTDEAKAVVHGESSAYKKCPFCAEAIRKEAIKCKHCGSDLLKVDPIVDAAKKAVNTKDLLIKKRDGFMINDDGMRKLVESFLAQSPESTDIYRDFEDEIAIIKRTLPSEVHESFIRKIKYWNNALTDNNNK
ncbi:zinc ribbon domain-containing protein [Xenorhabdus sp. XENO-1]|uniref:zinc ribbon domain-containing protein n=1 Tax=Xenorhabdus bovienii TaxID=40576 RepID=UPI0020CA299C|nr:zinc ribbon domain-containing protein [Xenorhabdus bovienii]MCP9269850.1 zinc ribbon domain-containing protein [Xenorhabdus bovienii subsp. africana]